VGRILIVAFGWLLGVAVLMTGTSVAQAEAPRRFWTNNHHHYTSPWYTGAHRIMIPYGCTRAPYYTHDPRCPGRQGFHHGIDIAMSCGTSIYAATRGRVLSSSAPGTPGPAYGPKAFRIRHHHHDFLFGHVRRVYVHAGDPVRPGQLIARSGRLGAPDGCHLHFEVRRAGGGLDATVAPRPFLRLTRAARSRVGP
jgi:hypothetical protein